jgi:hypothetical protein
MKIVVDPQEVKNTDLSHLSHYLQWNPDYMKYFNKNAGEEHYKLLAYLSTSIGGEIADIGTSYGCSALALSHNDQANIITTDIHKIIPEQQGLYTPLSRSNVKMYIVSGQAIISRIAQCQLVVLDMDPHEGPEEAKFIIKLMQYNFKGILVAGDINLNNGMKQFWNTIPSSLKKIDVTHLGHFTGTGIVVFDPDVIDVDVLPLV